MGGENTAAGTSNYCPFGVVLLFEVLCSEEQAEYKVVAEVLDQCEAEHVSRNCADERHGCRFTASSDHFSGRSAANDVNDGNECWRFAR